MKSIACEIDWQRVRADFPVTAHTAYLNSAAAGPVSRAVMEAGAGLYREMAEAGDAGWAGWLERREEVRARVARLINAEPDEIAFTTNTSNGMNLIVDALEGRGEVISCELEFPVSILPWMYRGLTVHAAGARDGVLELEDVTRLMSERTGVISLSHL